MYEIKPSSRFRKDVKLLAKRGFDIPLLTETIDLLASGGPLPAGCCDHALRGQWLGHRECHVTPDWLLIYRKYEDVLVLALSCSGTHSDLFKK